MPKIRVSNVFSEKKHKQLVADGGSRGSAAVSSQFLKNIINNTAIPNLTAVTHFLADFLIGFKKGHIRHYPLPPLLINHKTIIQ